MFYIRTVRGVYLFIVIGWEGGKWGSNSTRAELLLWGGDLNVL